jgi:hypothetical protein
MLSLRPLPISRSRPVDFPRGCGLLGVHVFGYPQVPASRCHSSGAARLKFWLGGQVKGGQKLYRVCPTGFPARAVGGCESTQWRQKLSDCIGLRQVVLAAESVRWVRFPAFREAAGPA